MAMGCLALPAGTLARAEMGKNGLRMECVFCGAFAGGSAQMHAAGGSVPESGSDGCVREREVGSERVMARDVVDESECERWSAERRRNTSVDRIAFHGREAEIWRRGWRRGGRPGLGMYVPSQKGRGRWGRLAGTLFRDVLEEGS
ncbi:hypothetical protein PYCCODRAFT_1216483 [Trametes coccinea BRFM310]|uniref:Uncharacterized protein n=1 Tax=Trametes coccinea (strain BRFM310) TaxID=1353009 RepID=A0A1Y2I6P6_TRAC3|nr:hypothetical protein PYCCODRAFT_1216483 [Trametes coccinea BRFM310]